MDVATLTADVLAVWDDDRQHRDRAVEVAAVLCLQWAPDAPDVVLREAVARCAGWLLDSPAGNLAAEEVGEQSATYAPGQRGALRHSGAMSVLSPWKARRAGVIG